MVHQDITAVDAPTDLLRTGWDYLPGGRYNDGRVEITPLQRALVNQDGSGGQPNPPLNLLGTHLERASNFIIKGEARDLRGEAVITLYGKAPIVADEFRIERPSIRLTLAGQALKVAIWDGSSQEASEKLELPLSKNDGSRTFSLQHKDEKLTLSVDGRQLSTIGATDIFENGTVWFGFDGADKWTLAKFSVESLDNDDLVVADASTMTVKKTKDSLQELATKKRPGFTIGAAMSLGPATTDHEYAEVAFGGNFGLLTIENALKWQFVHPQPDRYDFREADALVALAAKHSMKIHGHPLVFGEANPAWVQKLPVTTPADKAHVKAVMTDHIAKVVSHYKGKVASWDVVNEPLDNEDWGELRQHIWYRAMGSDYIAQAFNAAHKADPAAKLFINEWGLEMDDERWGAMIHLLQDLQKQNVPVYGVGFQSHVYHSEDRIDTKKLRARIQQLDKMGLHARISEIDVYGYRGTLVQAMQYADVLEACISEPACVSYTTWGISDRYNTYKEDDGTIAFGQDFLWTAEMDPTPAVKELRRILGE